jgi:hypothetical protein
VTFVLSEEGRSTVTGVWLRKSSHNQGREGKLLEEVLLGPTQPLKPVLENAMVEITIPSTVA